MIYDTENCLVVSTHNEPQVSPQEYDCGCVTAIHVTDRDYLRYEAPFEMRLVEFCDTEDCWLVRDIAVMQVDAEHGYTMEWAPHPEGHRIEYDLRADMLREHLTQ